MSDVVSNPLLAVHPNTEVACVNCGNVYGIEYTHVFGNDSDGKRVCCDCVEGLASEDAPLLSQSTNASGEGRRNAVTSTGLLGTSGVER